MRIDYFLKMSRIVKRRPLAKEMCDKKLILLNDHVAKSGKDVEVGDTILVKFQHRTLKVRVESVPERSVAKKDASSLYSILEDLQQKEDDLLW